MVNIVVMVAIQDDLWHPKCVRHGWYLPFEPPQHEYGAWKRHYIACIYTLDMELSTRTVSTADAVGILSKV